MRLPEYVTVEQVFVAVNGKESKTLPVQSFVQPIEFKYLPKHIQENSDGRSYNPKTEVFCYTHFGIVMIKRDKIRKI